MRILDIQIKHFGMFEDYSMEFNPGVNIVYGANETGKSTLHAFIRAMLFGAEPGRGRSQSLYARCQPWENGAYFAGVMRIEWQGRRWRIERNFYKNDRSVRVICEDNGREGDAQSILEQMLGGLSEAAYTSTIFVEQGRAAADEQLSEQLRRYMINVQENGDASVDVSEAVRNLQKRRRDVLREKQEQLDAIDEQIRGRQMERDYLKQALENPETDLQEAHSRQHGLEAAPRGAQGDYARPGDRSLREQDELEDTPAPAEEERKTQEMSRRRETEADEGRSRRTFDEEEGRADGTDEADLQGAGEREPEQTGGEASIVRRARLISRLCLALPAAAVICVALALFLAHGIVRAALLMGAALMVLVVLLIQAVLLEKKKEAVQSGYLQGSGSTRRESGADAMDPAPVPPHTDTAAWNADDGSAEAGAESAVNAGVKAAGDTQSLTRARSDLKAGRRRLLQDISDELQRLGRKRDELSAYDAEAEAMDLAAQRIGELARDACLDAGDTFAEEASGILAELTGGRYTTLSLDEHMHVSVSTPEHLLHLDQVSRATMDQIGFAMRLAGASLFGGEELPLVLDEPFTSYDDDRLYMTMAYLKHSHRQVILFTSQKREKDAYDRIP